MTMNARTPSTPLSGHSIPTVDEAKRRLAEAAGRPEPWLTPEGMAILEQAEDISFGVFGERKPGT